MRTGKEADKKQSMKDRRDDSYGKFGKRDKEHEDGKMHMGENSGTLKDAARQGVMARLAELAGIPAQEIEEALGTPQDIADKIMSEDPLDEADVEEGNEFSGERDKAIKAGKNDFTVDGKTYPVKGDKNESLEEADDDSDMPSKAHIEKMCKDGKTKKEICDMHPDCDQGKLKKMIDDCADHMDESEINEGAVKDMMQDVEEGMDKAEFEKKYPGQDYDGIKKDIEDRMDETTSSGSVATGEGAGKPLYNAPSIYENNEIVKRARQLNEDMSISVHAGTDAEPSININASGEDAGKMMELCKLAGIGGMSSMGMGSQPQSPYGEVEIQVAEDQEFANSANDTETADINTMVNTMSGGLNGQKKMAYPRASQGDNAMATLGESELVETSANQLMKQYQAFKTK